MSAKRLVDDAHGRVLHSQKFTPETAESGDLDPTKFELQDAWSDWTTAASQRDGAFGWWDEVHGAPPTPPAPIEFPFELRCRLRHLSATAGYFALANHPARANPPPSPHRALHFGERRRGP